MKNQLDPVLEAVRRSDFDFYYNVFQGKKSKPRKFKHSLKMNFLLFRELIDVKIFDAEDIYCDGAAFFSFERAWDKDHPGYIIQMAIISFANLFEIEDLHRKIDYYLVKKYMGHYPLERFGTFF